MMTNNDDEFSAIFFLHNECVATIDNSVKFQNIPVN